jgi:hypothetical protein
VPPSIGTDTMAADWVQSELLSLKSNVPDAESIAFMVSGMIAMNSDATTRPIMINPAPTPYERRTALTLSSSATP